MSHESCSFEELGDYERNECSYPKGGISFEFVLKEDHGIVDFSDVAEWEAAIAAGTVKILGPNKGELPEPSAVEGENPIACGSETITDAYDYTFEILDFNVNDTNDVLIKQLNASQFTGFGWYECETDRVRVVNHRTSFNARLTIPVSNKEKQKYMITAKWTQDVNDDIPLAYDAPAGIFV